MKQRQRDKQRKSDTQKNRDRERGRDTRRLKEKHKERQTHRETDTETQGQGDEMQRDTEEKVVPELPLSPLFLHWNPRPPGSSQPLLPWRQDPQVDPGAGGSPTLSSWGFGASPAPGRAGQAGPAREVALPAQAPGHRARGAQLPPQLASPRLPPTRAPVISGGF